MKRIFFSWILIAQMAIAAIVGLQPAQAQLQQGIFDRYFQQTLGQTYEVSEDPGQLEGRLTRAIGQIISLLIGLIGVLLLIIIVYAGFLWLTAGGETAQVEKAKAYIKNAVIGLILVLSAYIITSFVIAQIQKALLSEQPPAAPGTPTLPEGGPGGTGGSNSFIPQ